MQSYEDLKLELDRAYNNLDEVSFKKIIESLKNEFESKKRTDLKKNRFKKEDKTTLKNLFSRLRILEKVKPIYKYNKEQLQILKKNFIIQDDKSYTRKHLKEEKIDFSKPLTNINYKPKHYEKDSTVKHAFSYQVSLLKSKLLMARSKTNSKITKLVNDTKETIGIGIYLIEDKSSILSKKIKDKYTYQKRHAKEIDTMNEDIEYISRHQRPSIISANLEKITSVKEKLEKKKNDVSNSIKNIFKSDYEKKDNNILELLKDIGYNPKHQQEDRKIDISEKIEKTKETIGIGLYIVEDKTSLLGKSIKRKFESTKKVINKGSKFVVDKVKGVNEKRKQIIEDLKKDKYNLLHARDNQTEQTEHRFLK